MQSARPFAKPKPLSAGDLTEIVSIEAETVTADGYGGRARTWAQLTRAWAKIAPMAAREGIDDGAERHVATYRVTLHRNPAITAGMRVAWGDMILEIVEAPPVPAHQLLMVLVAESNPNAEPAETPEVGDWMLDYSNADNSMYIGQVT